VKDVGGVFVGGFWTHVTSQSDPCAATDRPPAPGSPPPGLTWRVRARDLASHVWGVAREWVEERFLVAGTTLKRRDHARWQQAESVQDLCDLTAGWLTGEIASHPGYYGPVDVEEHDAPGLTNALVALNRIGFWTRTSQAGADGDGYDGAHWTQLAAVDGFADRALAERLEHALAGTRFRIQAHPVGLQGHEGVVVTRREGHAHTRFGGSTDDEDLATHLAGVGERAARAVRAGTQVVIWDPRVGRNDLWPVLNKISRSAAWATARADPARPDPGP
jgi:hypothetical protein